MILTVRTDKPEAEIGLFVDGKEQAYETWQAHRKLAETIHTKIDGLLADQHKTLADIRGVVAYKGPGSFTGLRIGLSVANALAYGLDVPIFGATGTEWKETGIAQLAANKGTQAVMPEYGSPVHITKPRK